MPELKSKSKFLTINQTILNNIGDDEILHSSKDMDSIIRFSYRHDVSDIHILNEYEIVFRVDGELHKLKDFSGANIFKQRDPKLLDRMNPNYTKKLSLELLKYIEKDIEHLEKQKSIDFAYQISGLGRFRVNVFLDRGVPAIACRILPSKIPTFDELFKGINSSIITTFQRFCSLPHGIVLVTGATGSGKSTTLASMVDYINSNFKKHIITMEDPIEYTHKHKLSIINQREIGRDLNSFADGLRAALREDPDIILVGEMRDLETIEIALRAAKTGHLVFSTLHTNSTVETIDRIISMFPGEKQNVIRSDLSDSLRGIIAQRLIRRKEGGRVPGLEILVSTTPIQNLIRENKVFQIKNVMQTSLKEGMILIDKSIHELIRSGVIDQDVAEEHVVNTDILNSYSY